MYDPETVAALLKAIHEDEANAEYEVHLTKAEGCYCAHTDSWVVPTLGKGWVPVSMEGGKILWRRRVA
jgi:hypothetical protein